jgi:thioredoxin 1
MGANAFTVTDATFTAEIEEFKGVVLVDFWAQWCGPCLAMADGIETLAAKYANNPHVRIAKIDIDQNTATTAAYRILSIPNFKFFVNGVHDPKNPDHSMIGMRPIEDIEAQLQKHIDSLGEEVTTSTASV